jgi:hypothetical protein
MEDKRTILFTPAPPLKPGSTHWRLIGGVLVEHRPWESPAPTEVRRREEDSELFLKWLEESE